ncbi:hypothetical protein AB6A40_001371 [Gnathostoma spinigerum]|uniref:DUF3677 domain-containing protein n=1 Tax=Gnathostoma spinigerum TaxID=75299 RepID=A0ABD6EDT5_9BILA
MMSKQSKGKANLPAGGFVPLGREGYSSSSDPSSSRSKSHFGVTKRELPHSHVSSLKRPKLDFLSRAGGAPSTSAVRRFQPDETKWREFCCEVLVETKSLLASLENAFEKGKPQKATKLFCSAIRLFIDHRKAQSSWSCEPLLCSSLMLFVKRHPHFMQKEFAVSALCSVLAMPISNSSIAPSVAPCVLYSLLKDSSDWSWTIVECFVDDSLHERLWVDRSINAPFLQNILTAFGTKIPTEAMYAACELTFPDRYSYSESVPNRFDEHVEKVENVVNDLRDILEKRADGVSRNLLKTMCSCAGNGQVRLLAARKMDSWLLNGKLQRHAMELLLWIARNMGGTSSECETETLSALLKLRALKSKQINNLFNVALKEILKNDPENMNATMNLLLANEFSSNRFAYNMTMIHSLFLFDNAAASKVLAQQLCQMLSIKEEYLRLSRTFLREFVRSLLRNDFQFSLFTQHIFEIVTECFTSSNSPVFLFKSVVDLCSMVPFLAVTSAVREGSQIRRTANATLSQLHIDALQKFYVELGTFFELCVSFLTSVSSMCSDNRFYVYSFYRLLYLAPVDSYSNPDSWPVEAEVNQYIRAIADAPLSETLLTRILEAGANQTVPIDAADAIDLVETLTKRACLSSPLTASTSSMVAISNSKTVQILFETTAYRPPPNFPVSKEELPALAVRRVYWKAWIIAVMWASLNKQSLIKEIYMTYPTLKIILQMILTWEYRFPPIASACDSEGAEKMLLEDEQELIKERETIKKLEARLAGNEVAESDSRLLGLLCNLDPTGICRQPPDYFFKDLEELNADLDLSRSFSECRDPDLLADLIRSQGSSRALPSVINLVSSNANAIVHLPLECICDLFLHYILSSVASSIYPMRKLTTEKVNAMRVRLRRTLKGKNATEQSTFEIIEYLFGKLRSTSPTERLSAAHCFSLLLQSDANAPLLPVSQHVSPIRHLHSITFFNELKGKICELVAGLCPVETDPLRLKDYINFVLEHMETSSFHLVACHISSMVERLTGSRSDADVRIAAMAFYKKYMEHSCMLVDDSASSEKMELPSDEKHVRVQFFDENHKVKLLEMSSSAVGGMLQLLCSNLGEEKEASRQALMELWFPSHGYRPKILNAVGNELLPPWLKLKMLSSDDIRIVHAALDDMKRADALKFIQSFALTTYSSSKLMEIIDDNTSPLDDDCLKNAVRALPYIRAYKLKGATGADELLARFEKVQNQEANVKMETDDLDHLIEIDPPPSIVQNSDAATFELSRLSVESIVNCVDSVIGSNNFSHPHWCSSVRQIATDVESCCAVIALLKRKTSLFSNAFVVSSVLIAMGGLIRKDDAVRKEFESLSVSVSKKANISSSLKKTFSNYMGVETDPKEKLSPNKRSIQNFGAEQLLKLLSDPPKDFDQSNLIQQYLCLCPEVVPSFLSDSSQMSTDDRISPYTVIPILFSVESPAIKHILSLIPTRCSPEMISNIISHLLDSHNSSLLSESVVNVVENSLCLADPPPLTRGRCAVLVEYLVDELQRDMSRSRTVLKIIDDIIKSQEDAAYCLLSTFSDVLSSSSSSERKRCVRKLIVQFSATHPGVSLETGLITVRSLIPIGSQDRIVHDLLCSLFRSPENDMMSASKLMIDKLSQIARSQPHVFVRHLALISAFLIGVVRLPMRQLRDNYQPILAFLLKLLSNISSLAVNESVNVYVESILVSFFCFFENAGRSRFWMSLATAFLSVCISYLEFNTRQARLLYIPYIHVIKDLASTTESPYGKILLDGVSTLEQS